METWYFCHLGFFFAITSFTTDASFFIIISTFQRTAFLDHLFTSSRLLQIHSIIYLWQNMLTFPFKHSFLLYSFQHLTNTKMIYSMKAWAWQNFDYCFHQNVSVASLVSDYFAYKFIWNCCWVTIYQLV